MKTVASLLSLVITAMGVLGVASPAALLTAVRKLASPAGVYTAAALRLIMGSALHLSAPASRVPAIVRALGDLTFATGAITPVFGLERFRKIITWWAARGHSFVRAWSVFAVAFGLFLIWAVSPARPHGDTRAS